MELEVLNGPAGPQKQQPTNKQTQKHVWLMCAGDTRCIMILPHRLHAIPSGFRHLHYRLNMCRFLLQSRQKILCTLGLSHSVRFNKHDICLYSQLHKDSKSPEYKQDSVCLDTSAFCNASSMMLSVTADVLTGTWGVGHVLRGTAKKWYRSATTKRRLVLFLLVATVSWPRTIISDDLL